MAHRLLLLTLVRGHRHTVSILVASALALVAGRAIAADAAPAEPYDVVVIGGGPVGLATAIEARRNGARRVMILEQKGPDRSRVQSLGLIGRTHDNLARWDVDATRVGQAIDGLSIEHEGRATRFLPAAGSHEPANARRATGSAISILIDSVRHRRLSAVPINSLEEGLAATALKLGGIDMSYDREVVGIDEGADDVAIVAHDRAGAAYPVRGRYVAVADGSNSKTLALLGASGGQMKGTRRGALAWGAYQAKPTNVVKLHTSEAGGKTLAIPAGKSVVVGTGLPKDWDAEHGDVQALLDEAARKVGVEGAPIGDATTLHPVPRRASRVLIGKRIAAVGDAARSTSPIVALGINFALRDPIAFGKLFRRLEYGGKVRGALARTAYRAHDTTSSRLLQLASQDRMLKLRLQVLGFVSGRVGRH